MLHIYIYVYIYIYDISNLRVKSLKGIQGMEWLTADKRQSITRKIGIAVTHDGGKGRRNTFRCEVIRCVSNGLYFHLECFKANVIVSV